MKLKGLIDEISYYDSLYIGTIRKENPKPITRIKICEEIYTVYKSEKEKCDSYKCANNTFIHFEKRYYCVACIRAIQRKLKIGKGRHTNGQITKITGGQK